jgi:lipooligosaccharide transport system permease protein
VADAGAARRVARSYAYWAYAYRRTWRGSVISSFASPALYLAAMGLGLGALVDASASRGVAGLPYLGYVAPGILAATAMQTGAGEATYPVMSAIKWRRTYFAMLATPLGPGDALVGHLLWIATRVALAGAAFLAVMTLSGAASGPSVVLALPAAVLVGVAFAAPVMAFSATRRNDAGFAALFRFGLLPLFLFSGVFFPVAQLPALLRPVAYATPLWHGVGLCRGLALGRLDLLAAAGHVAYLLAMTALGLFLAWRAYARVLRR